MPDASRPHSELRDFLRRLSEWDVLNLTPGSGSDGPYWQGEIVKANAALDGLIEQYEGVAAELRTAQAQIGELTRAGGGDSIHLRIASEARERMHAAEDEVASLKEQLEALERDAVEFCHVLQLTAPKSCQSWVRKMTAARLAKVSSPARERQ